MKKLGLKLSHVLLCALTITVSFNTQAKGFSDILQLPEFQSGKTIWIVRAGVGQCGVTGSNTETQELLWSNNGWKGEFKKGMGYDVTFGFSKSFGNHPLYWGMELGMMTRGYKTSSSWERSGSSAISGGYDYHGKFQEDELLCHTVKLSPFTIGYRYTFLGKMAADVHLGAYASYDIAGKFTSEYTDHQWSTSKYGNTNKKTTTPSEAKIKDMDHMRRYDAGFNLGAGLWFGKFNIDFTWQRGFIAIYDNGDENVTIGKTSHKWGDLFSNNFQLKLGYAF